MLPFLGFSQQEQPKRVTVVVTAKEIAPQKEVVQLPADNIPVTINSKPKGVFKKKNPTFNNSKTKTAAPAKVQPEKAIISSSKVVATPKPKSKTPIKENAPIKTTVKPSNTTKPTATAPTKKQEVVAKAKPVAQPKTEQKETEKEIASPAPITRATTPVPNEKVNEASNNDNDALVKADQNSDTPQLSPDGQTNATSYIWIGIFLIIAGVVLGLLFGKPAFLISFVGVVFVALGMII